RAIARQGPSWTREALVAMANQLLPRYLGPAAPTLSAADLEAYQARGLVAKPAGPAYGYRQLLELLVIRRLSADGHGPALIGPLLAGGDEAALEALLASGVTLELTPGGARLAEGARRVELAPGLALLVGPGF